MSLVEQLRKIAAEQTRASPREPRYREMAEFYREMVRLGIAKKNVYELPRLDTIGKRSHGKRLGSREKTSQPVP